MALSLWGFEEDVDEDGPPDRDELAVVGDRWDCEVLALAEDELE